MKKRCSVRESERSKLSVARGQKFRFNCVANIYFLKQLWNVLRLGFQFPDNSTSLSNEGQDVGATSGEVII